VFGAGQVLLGVLGFAAGAGPATLRAGVRVGDGQGPVLPPGVVMPAEEGAGRGAVREGTGAAVAAGGMGVPGGGLLSLPQR
jgi:hypothetical protein